MFTYKFRTVLWSLCLISLAANIFAGEKKLNPRYNRLTNTWSSYPEVTIRDIQYRPYDSLLVADQLQNVGSRWTLQGANSTNWTYVGSQWYGDTVTVVGVCVIPAKVFTYTSIGYNLVLADTGYNGGFSHIFIRPYLSSSSNPQDSVYYTNMLSVHPGDIIEVTGCITEFPANSMNSQSQILPNKNLSYTIIGHQNIPPITHATVGDFYRGLYQSSYPNGVKYTTGESLEAKYVELTNLTVVSRLSTNYGVLIVDADGNNIATYDASKWFTTRAHKDPTSTYTHPADFSHIDTLRGWVTPVSGQQNNYGYNIAPVYPGDMVLGFSRPSITRVYRYPVIVTPDSAPRIQAAIRQLPLGNTIASRLIYYSINDGPFNIDTMLAISSDTLYSVNIPAQSIGTNVKYFIKVTDVGGYYSISASGASGELGTDTSKGFYFYKVTDGNLTIHDIQFTPYSNGRSPYVGAVTTIHGIVTSDTSDFGLAPINNHGVSVWHMQTGNGPFSGLWFTDTLSALKGLRKGDNVAVTGTVTEYHNYTNDVTCLDNIKAVEVISAGNPIPDAVKFKTGTFGPLVSNGDFNAEPWEGMLVEFDNVEVTNLNPTYQVFTEYNVNDGTGEITVLRDGKNTYSTVEGDTIYPGTTILKVGDKFVGLKGILHYSYNRYKICPRTNADFINSKGMIAGVKYNDLNKNGIRDVGESGIPNWKINLSGDYTSLVYTDVNGMYTFNNLDSGYYIISEEQKSKWIQTAPSSGSFNVSLATDDSISGLDFGNYHVRGMVSGVKYNDINNNGNKDQSETGILNWRIYISGKFIDSTLTDQNGYYQFNTLDSGNYIISEEQRFGWGQSFPAGGNYEFRLSLNDTINGNDFGNYQLNAVTVRKFLDIDGNLSTSNDRTSKLWNLNLYKDSVSSSTLIGSVSSGQILFTPNLTPGIYIATEADSQGWRSLGKIINGVNYPGNISADTFNLSNGQSRSIDFINFEPRVIIRKFVDADGDFLTTNDRAPKMWSVSIYKDTVNPSHLIVHPVAAESLVIVDPSPGSYIAVEADSVGWIPIGKIMDGVTVAGDVKSDTFIYSEGQIKKIDFINFHPNKIRIRKFYDRDGLLTTSNDRFPKPWHLSIYKENLNNLFATAIFSESLSVENLGNGTYIVKEADSTGWAHVGKIRNGTTYAGSSTADTFIVTGGQSVFVDFINTLPTITIRKYRDVDGNFNTTNDRSSVPWNLTLYRGAIAPTNIVASVASAESIVVNNLIPGNYIVREADSVGWSHIGTILDGIGAGNPEREVQFTVVNTESHTIDFVNKTMSGVVVRKFVDQDGNFATTGDRTLKNWNLRLYKDFISPGNLMGEAVSSSILTMENFPSGNYVAVEVDSANWSHISIVVDGVSQGGTASKIWNFNLVAGQSHMIDFVNFDLNRRKVWTAAIDCEWNNGGNWEPLGIPIPGDTIIVSPIAPCALIIPPGATLGTISIAVGETVKVKSGTTISITGDAIINGSLLVESDGNPTIVVDGNWRLAGNFVPEHSLVFFTGVKPQVIEGCNFFDVKIGFGSKHGSKSFRSLIQSPTVKTQGNWIVSGSLKMNTDLDAYQDTIFITNNVDTALTGDGVISRGSIQRYLKQGSVGRYQFESPNSYIQFNDTGVYPDKITMTVYPDTSPIDFTTTWYMFPSEIDTINNTIVADTVREFSYWSLGVEQFSQIVPIVRRVYSINSTNGNNYIARVSLRYNQAEVPPSVSEGSLRLVTSNQITPVEIKESGLPRNFGLEQNFPNPFNPVTTFTYSLPVTSHVNLRVFNILGQLVAIVKDEVQDAGYQIVQWDVPQGGISSGLYIYRLEATDVANPSRNFTKVMKMILVK